MRSLPLVFSPLRPSASVRLLVLLTSVGSHRVRVGRCRRSNRAGGARAGARGGLRVGVSLRCPTRCGRGFRGSCTTMRRSSATNRGRRRRERLRLGRAAGVVAGGGGGRFSQTWELYAEGPIPLPGGGAQWPLDVKVDGRAAVATTGGDDGGEGSPQVRVPAGRHTVTGTFVWKRLPETLPVPARAAMVSLTLGAREVGFPRAIGGGRAVPARTARRPGRARRRPPGHRRPSPGRGRHSAQLPPGSR